MKSRADAPSGATKPSEISGEAARLEERALRRLREHNFRVTMSRIQVIRVLAESRTPLTAYRIQEAVLSRGGRIDVVSVYRILSLMTQIGLAHHVGIVGGYIACRMEREHDNQLHLVCEDCGQIEEHGLSEQARLAVESHLKTRGARSKTITVEVLGRCATCVQAPDRT